MAAVSVAGRWVMGTKPGPKACGEEGTGCAGPIWAQEGMILEGLEYTFTG